MSKIIEQRKRDHVMHVLSSNIQYSKSAGFEKFEFVHNALPEVDFEKIDMSVGFLGKKLQLPLIIEAMTGGFKEAEKINKNLAKIAEQKKVAFGLGSQRAMLEDKELNYSFKVRDVAPTIPIIGNIGAVQLHNYSVKDLEWLVKETELNALAIHLNPLQEVIQPEGDKNFSGLSEKIGKVCKELSVPVIIKETGAGIDRRVALKAKELGAKYIDVAGAGGSSWSKVEYLRGESVPGFEEWGLPTCESILECKGVLPLIASGGIRNGIQVAKSIALGAEIAGAAYPFLRMQQQGKLSSFIDEWANQLKVCMFLTGSKDILDLKSARIALKA